MTSAVVEGAQRAFADHDPAAHPGQAVGQRLRDVEDAQFAGAGTGVGAQAIVVTPSRSTSIRWWARRRRVAIATLTTATHQAGADQQGQREDDDVEQPQRPAESVDLTDDGRGRAPVGTGHEEPAGDRDAGAERRQHGGDGDGLPQHDRGPRCAQRPRRPRQHRRHGTDQKHAREG